MRILTRYIVIELLTVFLLTLTAMTVVVFLVLIGKEAVDNGLGLVPLLRMLPYMVPQAMQFAVPGTMLLATTSVYGRISSSNEIVAVKSLGISPLSLVWPTFALATLVSFATLWINDMAVSWGHGGVQRVVLESLEEIIYGRLNTTHSYSNDQLKITVHSVYGKRLIQPTFLFFAEPDQPAWTLTADEAQIRTESDKQRVVLTLVNAEFDSGGKGSGYHPGELQYPLSFSEFGGESGRNRSPANYALREIGSAKGEQIHKIAQQRQEAEAEASFALLTGRTFELSGKAWQDQQHEIISAENTLHRLKTEPHRRWANGFSCLCFVMLGVPMAINRRHGEFWGSFFACFLPILLIYYPMMVGCLDRAKEGDFPAPSVWLGNFVLAGLGIWLMRRVVRF